MTSDSSEWRVGSWSSWLKMVLSIPLMVAGEVVEPLVTVIMVVNIVVGWCLSLAALLLAGWTFALYSLICRQVKVGLLPNQQVEAQQESNYQLELPQTLTAEWQSKFKFALQNSRAAKFILLFATMLATSLVIGDGILTPCVSVLSAVEGIQAASPSLTQGLLVWIAVAVLIFLFVVQGFGTDKVGYTFAPILSLWFVSIAIIGIYNFIKYDPSVVKAANPWQIVEYFKRNGKQAWVSLGGVIMCLTGTEALFADLGHFSVRSIQISMCFVVYPAIILQYSGQASYLRHNPGDVADAFYKSIPGPIYWPVFVIAVLAAIIASQSMISGTFSIIQQSLSLGCFPRVKVVHTSSKYEGQVYIPEVNYILMLACVCVTFGFQTTKKLSNAYGIAVVGVLVITSLFLVLVMTLIWKTHILLIIPYMLITLSIETVYLTSALYKFPDGGYVSLAFAAVLVAIMYTWNDVYRKKYYYEMDRKVSPEQVRDLAIQTKLHRIPGVAIFYSELVHGIPPIFKQYAMTIPALHSVLIFVSFKSLPINKVLLEEPFLFRRVPPRELHMFRCVVRYGYNDVGSQEQQQEPFEGMLVGKLKEFIMNELESELNICEEEIVEAKDSAVIATEREANGGGRRGVEGEIEALDEACRAGVVHLTAESEVVASRGSGLGKKVLINYGYNLLKRNSRQSNKVFDIPHERLLKVGMTYEL
ncbi:hypothetical protein Ancab_037027 [Ancistrocladus abbreviatus]